MRNITIRFDGTYLVAAGKTNKNENILTISKTNMQRKLDTKISDDEWNSIDDDIMKKDTIVIVFERKGSVLAMIRVLKSVIKLMKHKYNPEQTKRKEIDIIYENTPKR